MSQAGNVTGPHQCVVDRFDAIPACGNRAWTCGPTQPDRRLLLSSLTGMVSPQADPRFLTIDGQRP